MTAGSWLDWKLGARMLLKYPALTIVGGLSLAAAIAIGVVGIEVANELLFKRLPFEEGGRIVRLETQDVAASVVEPRVLHDFALWRRSLTTVVEIGAARVGERNVITGDGRVDVGGVDGEVGDGDRHAHETTRGMPAPLLGFCSVASRPSPSSAGGSRCRSGRDRGRRMASSRRSR